MDCTRTSTTGANLYCPKRIMRKLDIESVNKVDFNLIVNETEQGTDFKYTGCT